MYLLNYVILASYNSSEAHGQGTDRQEAVNECLSLGTWYVFNLWSLWDAAVSLDVSTSWNILHVYVTKRCLHQRPNPSPLMMSTCLPFTHYTRPDTNILCRIVAVNRESTNDSSASLTLNMNPTTGWNIPRRTVVWLKIIQPSIATCILNSSSTRGSILPYADTITPWLHSFYTIRDIYNLEIGKGSSDDLLAIFTDSAHNFGTFENSAESLSSVISIWVAHLKSMTASANIDLRATFE